MEGDSHPRNHSQPAADGESAGSPCDAPTLTGHADATGDAAAVYGTNKQPPQADRGIASGVSATADANNPTLASVDGAAPDTILTELEHVSRLFLGLLFDGPQDAATGAEAKTGSNGQFQLRGVSPANKMEFLRALDKQVQQRFPKMAISVAEGGSSHEDTLQAPEDNNSFPIMPAPFALCVLLGHPYQHNNNSNRVVLARFQIQFAQQLLNDKGNQDEGATFQGYVPLSEIHKCHQEIQRTILYGGGVDDPFAAAPPAPFASSLVSVLCDGLYRGKSYPGLLTRERGRFGLDVSPMARQQDHQDPSNSGTNGHANKSSNVVGWLMQQLNAAGISRNISFALKGQDNCGKGQKRVRLRCRVEGFPQYPASVRQFGELAVLFRNDAWFVTFASLSDQSFKRAAKIRELTVPEHGEDEEDCELVPDDDHHIEGAMTAAANDTDPELKKKLQQSGPEEEDGKMSPASKLAAASRTEEEDDFIQGFFGFLKKVNSEPQQQTAQKQDLACPADEEEPLVREVSLEKEDAALLGLATTNQATTRPVLHQPGPLPLVDAGVAIIPTDGSGFQLPFTSTAAAASSKSPNLVSADDLLWSQDDKGNKSSSSSMNFDIEGATIGREKLIWCARSTVRLLLFGPREGEGSFPLEGITRDTHRDVFVLDGVPWENRLAFLDMLNQIVQEEISRHVSIRHHESREKDRGFRLKFHVSLVGKCTRFQINFASPVGVGHLPAASVVKYHHDLLTTFENNIQNFQQSFRNSLARAAATMSWSTEFLANSAMPSTEARRNSFKSGQSQEKGGVVPMFDNSESQPLNLSSCARSVLGLLFYGLPENLGECKLDGLKRDDEKEMYILDGVLWENRFMFLRALNQAARGVSENISFHHQESRIADKSFRLRFVDALVNQTERFQIKFLPPLGMACLPFSNIVKYQKRLDAARFKETYASSVWSKTDSNGQQTVALDEQIKGAKLPLEDVLKSVETPSVDFAELANRLLEVSRLVAGINACRVAQTGEPVKRLRKGGDQDKMIENMLRLGSNIAGRLLEKLGEQDPNHVPTLIHVVHSSSKEEDQHYTATLVQQLQSAGLDVSFDNSWMQKSWEAETDKLKKVLTAKAVVCVCTGTAVQKKWPMAELICGLVRFQAAKGKPAGMAVPPLFLDAFPGTDWLQSAAKSNRKSETWLDDIKSLFPCFEFPTVVPMTEGPTSLMYDSKGRATSHAKAVAKSILQVLHPEMTIEDWNETTAAVMADADICDASATGETNNESRKRSAEEMISDLQDTVEQRESPRLRSNSVTEVIEAASAMAAMFQQLSQPTSSLNNETAETDSGNEEEDASSNKDLQADADDDVASPYFPINEVINDDSFFWVGSGGRGVTNPGNKRVRSIIASKSAEYLGLERSRRGELSTKLLNNELSHVKFVIQRDSVLANLELDDKHEAEGTQKTRRIGLNRRRSLFQKHKSIEQIRSYPPDVCILVGTPWAIDVINHQLREVASARRQASVSATQDKDKDSAADKAPPPKKRCENVLAEEIGEHDLLLGCNTNAGQNGNAKFQSLIEQHAPRYVATPKAQKPGVVDEVLQLWRGLNPPGRFLSTEGTARGDGLGVWKDVGDSRAREKVSISLSQAIREAAPKPAAPVGNSRDPGLLSEGAKRKRTLAELQTEFRLKHPTTKRSRVEPHDVVPGKGERAKQQNEGYRAMIREYAPVFRSMNTGDQEKDLEEKRKLAYQIALTVVDRGGCFIGNDGEPMDAKLAYKRCMTSLKDWRPPKRKQTSAVSHLHHARQSSSAALESSSVELPTVPDTPDQPANMVKGADIRSLFPDDLHFLSSCPNFSPLDNDVFRELANSYYQNRIQLNPNLALGRFNVRPEIQSIVDLLNQKAQESSNNPSARFRVWKPNQQPRERSWEAAEFQEVQNPSDIKKYLESPLRSTLKHVRMALAPKEGDAEKNQEEGTIDQHQQTSSGQSEQQHQTNIPLELEL